MDLKQQFKSTPKSIDSVVLVAYSASLGLLTCEHRPSLFCRSFHRAEEVEKKRKSESKEESKTGMCLDKFTALTLTQLCVSVFVKYFRTCFCVGVDFGFFSGLISGTDIS